LSDNIFITAIFFSQKYINFLHNMLCRKAWMDVVLNKSQTAV